jgi:hypothetical protein
MWTQYNPYLVVLYGLTLSLDPRLADSNPAEGDGFLRAGKVRNTPSFGGEVKSSPPCRKFYDMLKNASKYEIHTS